MTCLWYQDLLSSFPIHYPFSPLLFSLFLCIFEDYAGVWGWRKSAELLQYLTDYLWQNRQNYYLNLETTSQISLPSVIPAYNWSKIATMQDRKEAIEISIRILQWSNWQRSYNMCPCSPVTIFLTTLAQGWPPPPQCCLFRNSSALRGKSFPLMSPWIPLYRPCIQTYVHHYCFISFRNSVCDARNTTTS